MEMMYKLGPRSAIFAVALLATPSLAQVAPPQAKQRKRLANGYADHGSSGR